MWNNAGRFLAPRQVPQPGKGHTPVFPPSSSDTEDLDVDFIVTTPVQTPQVLDITRRDPFWGSEKPVHATATTQFFNTRNVQAPRLIHEAGKIIVHIYTYICYYDVLHNIYNAYTKKKLL